MDAVNEGSTAWLICSFEDRHGNLEAPTGVSYRVDCLTNNAEVRDDTTVTPEDEVELTLTAADNAIIAAANEYETRQVTVTATFAGGQTHVAAFVYRLVNLQFRP